MRRRFALACVLLAAGLAHCGGRVVGSTLSFVTPPCDPGDGTSACDVEGTTCISDSEVCRCADGRPLCPSEEQRRCASGNPLTRNACLTPGLKCKGLSSFGTCEAFEAVCTCDGRAFQCTESLCPPEPRSSCPPPVTIRDGAACPVSLQHMKCRSNGRCDELPSAPPTCACEGGRWACPKPCGDAVDASAD